MSCKKFEELSQKISKATLEKATYKVGVLKLLMGETQRLPTSVVLTDKHIENIAKKMIEGNNETLKYVSDEEKKKALAYENEILGEFLPRLASREEILVEVTKIKDDLVGKMDSQAYGIAMKKMKELNMNADFNLVKQVVDQVRT